jgi:hypothetical protein
MVTAFAADGIVQSAAWVDAVPALAPRVPPPSLAVVAAYYAGLALAIWGSRRLRIAGILIGAAVAAIVVAGATVAWPPSPAAGVRLTVLDVGQGDSVLLETGATTPLLVDTGGAPFGSTFDVGARVVVPALWARGVRALSTMVVTHGDPDHIGGALGVLESMRVSDAWLGVRMPAHAPSEALIAALSRRRAGVTFVRAGQTTTRNGVRLRVLNPPEPDWERRRVRNDDSVVIEATIGDVASPAARPEGRPPRKPHLLNRGVHRVVAAAAGDRQRRARELVRSSGARRRRAPVARRCNGASHRSRRGSDRRNGRKPRDLAHVRRPERAPASGR